MIGVPFGDIMAMFRNTGWQCAEYTDPLHSLAARAASGHAPAAPPMSVMNSRRCMCRREDRLFAMPTG
jgi:hypothetical protein